MALAGGPHLFGYALGNPALNTDPRGLYNVQVRKVDEVKYQTLKAYQTANPCGIQGTSYACTQRLLEDFGCICSCKGTGYGMDVQITVDARYHLAGGPPNSNNPPAFFHNGYRQHEDLHFVDLENDLRDYADDLEKLRFDTIDACNIKCGQSIGGFPQWLTVIVGLSRRISSFTKDASYGAAK